MAGEPCDVVGDCILLSLGWRLGTLVLGQGRDERLAGAHKNSPGS